MGMVSCASVGWLECDVLPADGQTAQDLPPVGLCGLSACAPRREWTLALGKGFPGQQPQMNPQTTGKDHLPRDLDKMA